MAEDGKTRRRWGWRRKLALFLGIFVALLVHGILYDRHQCVEMPNGFLIGRATVFSSLIGWGPDIAIRYPDGRIFLRGDVDMDFWDKEGFGGEFDRPRGENGDFIFLNDLGLITRKDQPELYQNYFEKKRKEHENSPETHGGHVMRTYLILNDDKRNRRSWCRTNWYLPKETR